MSSSSLKNELADHIYQYLCHEAQYSDLPEAARESLTAASECIEQAYKLNVSNNLQNTNNNNNNNNNSTTTKTQQQASDVIKGILPDELLRIFTRHKEFLGQQQQQNRDQPQQQLQVQHQHQQHQQQQQQQHNESGSGSSSSGHHHQHKHKQSHHHHMKKKRLIFKQKLIALIKKFRTDGSDFDSEEQYREALERELMKAAAGRGSRDIEELLEEEIDVDEESGSDTEDWDNISESSTPKPSLRPFFST